jgi:hypothetical protein
LKSHLWCSNFESRLWKPDSGPGVWKPPISNRYPFSQQRTPKVNWKKCLASQKQPTLIYSKYEQLWSRERSFHKRKINLIDFLMRLRQIINVGKRTLWNRQTKLCGEGESLIWLITLFVSLSEVKPEYRNI